MLRHWRLEGDGAEHGGLLGSDGKPKPAPAASLQAPVVWLPSPAQIASAGLVGLLAGALYYLWPVLRLGGIGLFSRVKGSQLLDSPVRSRIVDLVNAHPGVHFKELRRVSGLGNGVLVHHLRKLLDAGMVTAQRSGRYLCYFPKAVTPAKLRSVEALKAEGARRVLDAIRISPGDGPGAIALRCGLATSTVHYHLGRLEHAGLVQILRVGRNVQVRAAA